MADPSTLLLLAAGIGPTAVPPSTTPPTWTIAARNQVPMALPTNSISQPEAITTKADAPPGSGSLPHPPKLEGRKTLGDPSLAEGSANEIPPPTETPSPLLAYGATGGEVVSLQIRLQQLDFYRGELDGIYGGQTEAAVYHFQVAHGLVPDGVAGPQTWETLRQAGRELYQSITPSAATHSGDDRHNSDTSSNRATNLLSQNQSEAEASQPNPGKFFGSNIQSQSSSATAQDDRSKPLVSNPPQPPDTPDQNPELTPTDLRAEGGNPSPLARSSATDSFTTGPAPNLVSEASPSTPKPPSSSATRPATSSDRLVFWLLISIVAGFASGGGLIMLLRYQPSETIGDDVDLESDTPEPWSSPRLTHSGVHPASAASGLQAFSTDTPELPPALTVFPGGAAALSPSADPLLQSILDWVTQWQKSLDELWWPPTNTPSTGRSPQWLALPSSWQAWLREWAEQEKSTIEVNATAAESTSRSSAWLQTTVWLLTGAVSITIVWAMVTKVEQQIPTEGELVLPSPAELQAPTSPSTIQTVHVAEGQMVQAGDLLISLDAAPVQAELKQLEDDRSQLQAQLLFLQAQLLPQPTLQTLPAGLDPDLATLARHRAELLAEASTASESPKAAIASLGEGLRPLAFHQEVVTLVIQQLEDQLAEVQVQLSEARKALNRTQAQMQGIQALATNLTSRPASSSTDTSTIAKLQIIQQQQDLNTQQTEINRLTATEQQLRQALLEAHLRAEAAATIPKTPLPSDLKEIETRLNQAIQQIQDRLDTLETQIGRNRNLLATQTLTAPIAGKVFDLRTPPPGTPIDPQKPILKILPRDAVLVEVEVKAQDLDMLAPGMAVDLYLEDKMGQPLGTFEGSVVKIASSPPPSQGSQPSQHIPVQIQLTQPLMALPNQQALYTTTMPVNVQIRVGDRTIASLLSDWLGSAL